tara:strand:- start:132 stop:323 length:192 start_codon:yes stop_codon:yes gene_type:complete
MPYHITKPCVLDSSITLYYQGGTRWTDEYSKRNLYNTKSGADKRADNSSGENGGFKYATVVEE